MLLFPRSEEVDVGPHVPTWSNFAILHRRSWACCSNCLSKVLSQVDLIRTRMSPGKRFRLGVRGGFKNVCPDMMGIEVAPIFRDSERVQTHCFGCDSCVKLTIAHSEDRVPVVMSGQTFLKPPRTYLVQMKTDTPGESHTGDQRDN